ncbi:hypothetical protein [Hyphomicrobium sp.]|uniref:hypothetical protein n=1 Tax=Hyphomicrobium sp. TaxID=82 RepID=UPI0025BC46CF|nr:hypothetical protein [Hyphomicrobium sp.]
MRSADILALPEPFNGPRKSDPDMLIRRVADTVHRLNQQITNAVSAGVTVELMRASRHHNGCGQWGDQMVPMVKVAERAVEES